MNFESLQFKTLRESIELMPQSDALYSVGEMKKLVTSSSLIIIDNDIVSVYINPDTEFGNAEADENIKAILSEVGDRKVYTLLVPDVTTRITVEVRDYENKAFDEIQLAEAYVIKQLAHRILAKAYLIARGVGTCPAKVFNTEADALVWLNGLRDKT